jgi:hypothetical protein
MNRYYQYFLRDLWSESDIAEHLPLLFALATRAEIIVEFGVRSGKSTTAFLAGQSLIPKPTRLFSFDINDYSKVFVGKFMPGDEWVFARADTSVMPTIPECEILFIDTLHTANQVRRELRHADRVESMIILHDTVLFGENGEANEPGINLAIAEFLASHSHWRKLKEYQHNNGLMIMERTQ